MPTLNPRITITLRPEVAAVMRRLSVLTGNSQSSMVGELLAESLPVFERMAKVLEAAAQAREQAMQAPAEVSRNLERAQNRIEAQLGLVLDDFDEVVRPLLRDSEKVQRRGTRTAARRPVPAAAAVPTPLSNRGVRSTQRGQGKASKVHKGGQK